MLKLISVFSHLEKKVYSQGKKFFSTDKRKDQGIAVLYIALLIIFFLHAFLTSYMHGDFIAYWVPNYRYLLDSLHSGYIPFWQPYAFLGLPELFKLELVLFYPPVWILLLINFIFNPSTNLTFLGKSIEVMQYCNFFIGALGMYVLLRKKFVLERFPAFFGGCIFVFSIYITIQAGDISSLPGKLYLPWITYLALNFIERNTFRNYFYLVFVNYLLFSLGYPYNYVYFFILQLVLASFYGYKKIIGVVLAFANAVLIAGFFLLPNLHILRQSVRGVISTVDDPLFHLRYSYFPTKIINIFNPQVFTNLYDSKDPMLLFSMGMLSWGVISLIFLVLGFTNMKINKLTIWTCLLFVFGFLISLGGYLGIPESLKIIFPVIEKFRSHSQILSITFFAGVIVIAMGVESVMKGYQNKKVFFFLWEIVIILAIYLITLPLHCHNCTNDLFDVVISISRSGLLLFIGLLLIHLSIKSKNSIFLVACLGITLLEFSFYAQNIPYLRMKTPYADYYKANSLIVETPSNENLFRYSFVENQFIYNTSPLKIFNKEGYETVPYQAYNALGRLGEDNIFQFTNTKYLVTTKADEDKRLPILSLVKKVDPREHSDEVFFGTIKGLAYFSPQVENTYYIYKVANFFPRFFIPTKVKTCFDAECYTNKDLLAASFTREAGIDIHNPDRKDVVITISSYLPNTINLVVSTPRDTFVASSEIWDKGWHITLNDKSATLYNVNSGFRGFVVPAGKTYVAMSYFPPYLLYGLISSAMGGGMILSYFIFYKYFLPVKSKLK